MSAKRKLTEANVEWVRKMRARHGISYARLGRAVGCSAQHARDIVHGRRRSNRRADSGMRKGSAP